MNAVVSILNIAAGIWVTLGMLLMLGYVRRSLYSDRFLRYYLVSTGALILLATLLRYVRMEE